MQISNVIARILELVIGQDEASPIGCTVLLGKLDLQVTLQYGAEAMRNFVGRSQEPGSGECAENLPSALTRAVHP